MFNGIIVVLFCCTASLRFDDIVEGIISQTLNDSEILKQLQSNNDSFFNESTTSNRTFITQLYLKDYYNSLFYLFDNHFSPKSLKEEDSLIKDILTLKKYMEYYNHLHKEVIKITPLFEWAQNHTHIKMRIKFAKGLEVPGDKHIANFTVSLPSNALFTVSGFKPNEQGYIVWYYRRINLFAVVKPHTLSHYQETEGSFIVSFEKAVATMYWNFLDLEVDDHKNIFTWFDVFEKYDNEVKYVEYREWTRDNLLLDEMQRYIDEKVEEKKRRKEKVEALMKNVRDKGEEIDNYCHTVPFEEECYPKDVYDWNYWLS